MNSFAKLRFAAAVVVLATPALVHAGTRASASVVTVVVPAKPQVGPKNGFPQSPGLEIAKIKANPNAAFNRPKSNGA